MSNGISAVFYFTPNSEPAVRTNDLYRPKDREEMDHFFCQECVADNAERFWSAKKIGKINFLELFPEKVCQDIAVLKSVPRLALR